jgi:hypothetical protein
MSLAALEWELYRMFEQIDVINVTAAAARAHVVELQAERALAEATGVASIESYIHDLDWELDAWRQVYVTAAVTEIASLRAQLAGKLRDG